MGRMMTSICQHMRDSLRTGRRTSEIRRYVQRKAYFRKVVYHGRRMRRQALFLREISPYFSKRAFGVHTEDEQFAWSATEPKGLQEAPPESDPSIDKDGPPPPRKSLVDAEYMAVEDQEREFDRIQYDPEEALTGELEAEEPLQCLRRGSGRLFDPEQPHPYAQGKKRRVHAHVRHQHRQRKAVGPVVQQQLPERALPDHEAAKRQEDRDAGEGP